MASFASGERHGAQRCKRTATDQWHCKTRKPTRPSRFPALSTAEELNDACFVGGAGRLCRANTRIRRVIFLVGSKPTNRAEAVGSRRVRPELVRRHVLVHHRPVAHGRVRLSAASDFELHATTAKGCGGAPVKAKSPSVRDRMTAPWSILSLVRAMFWGRDRTISGRPIR